MTQVIIGRLLMSVILAGGFAAAAAAITAGNRRWVRSRIGRSPVQESIRSSNPTLFYFWSARCAQCKLQERQIEQARSTLEQRGRVLSIRKIDALHEKDLAKSMHVMTVPTTVLLDADGNVAA